MRASKGLSISDEVRGVSIHELPTSRKYAFGQTKMQYQCGNIIDWRPPGYDGSIDDLICKSSEENTDTEL